MCPRPSKQRNTRQINTLISNKTKRFNIMNKQLKFIVIFVFFIFATAFAYRFYNEYNSDWARVNRALRAYKAGEISKAEFNAACDVCNYPMWKVK